MARREGGAGEQKDREKPKSSDGRDGIQSKKAYELR